MWVVWFISNRSPAVGNWKTKDLSAIKLNICAKAVKSDSFHNNRTCKGAHTNIYVKNINGSEIMLSCWKDAKKYHPAMPLTDFTIFYSDI